MATLVLITSGAQVSSFCDLSACSRANYGPLATCIIITRVKIEQELT